MAEGVAEARVEATTVVAEVVEEELAVLDQHEGRQGIGREVGLEGEREIGMAGSDGSLDDGDGELEEVDAGEEWLDGEFLDGG